MRWREQKWNPYVTGALAGVVAILSVWVTGKDLGASTTFAKSTGMILKTVAADEVSGMDYFVKYQPEIDWQFMFVAGILIGSFIAAMLSKTFRWQAVPHMWRSQFNDNVLLRAVTAFMGGALALFGTRLAGGCPSGHGLSGLMQMSVSGYLAVLCFFAGGMMTARLLYGGGKKS